MTNVYCYHDPYRWGEFLTAAVRKRQGSAQMFTHSIQVPDEKSVVAFVHYTETDKNSLRIRDELLQKVNARIIPSYDEARLFNDRIAQYRFFEGWLPTTWLSETYADALNRINSVTYPVISKTRESAGYRGVRYIADGSGGFSEVNTAFGDKGIPGPDQIVQKDYLLWQAYVTNPGYSWRILMIAQRYAIVTKRYYATAKAEDCEIEQKETLTDEIRELLKFAYIFCVDNGFKWAGIDIICGMDLHRKLNSPFVTAMTVTWPPWWFDQGGMIFESMNGELWESTGLPAVSIWDVVAQAILEGQFHG